MEQLLEVTDWSLHRIEPQKELKDFTLAFSESILVLSIRSTLISICTVLKDAFLLSINIVFVSINDSYVPSVLLLPQKALLASRLRKFKRYRLYAHHHTRLLLNFSRGALTFAGLALNEGVDPQDST